MGEQRQKIVSSQIAGTHWCNLDDYPPGTPLPEPPQPDLSELNPIWRALLSRSHRKGRSHLMARAAAARDEYFRRKALDEDGPDKE